MADALSPDQFWHGTPSGDLRGGHYGLHLGSRQAAKEALEARIGRPAEGEWDGTRIYGKTLLDQSQSYETLPPAYPSGEARYSNGERVSLDAVPDIFPVRIIGKMRNTPQTPIDDDSANNRMIRQKRRGTASVGNYYTNEGEHYGSLAAVVPGQGHIERLDRGVPKQMRLF